MRKAFNWKRSKISMVEMVAVPRVALKFIIEGETGYSSLLSSGPIATKLDEFSVVFVLEMM
jgi:hypothetical protein